MKRILLFILFSSPAIVFSATPPTPAVTINNPDGRLQYYPRLSSTTLSQLLGGTTSQEKIDVGGSGYPDWTVDGTFSGLNVKGANPLLFKSLDLAGDLYILNLYTEPQ